MFGDFGVAPYTPAPQDIRPNASLKRDVLFAHAFGLGLGRG